MKGRMIMKKIIKCLAFVLVVGALMVAAYIPCRSYAVAERGTSRYYGGECLAPVVVLMALAVKYWNYEESEEADRRKTK